MATDRYQRGLDRMMELVSAGHSNTFDHVKLVESYKSLDPDLSDYLCCLRQRVVYRFVFGLQRLRDCDRGLLSSCPTGLTKRAESVREFRGGNRDNPHGRGEND